MKIIKYFFMVVALIALIFFGMGLITPSVSYGSEVTVDKSAEESWAVMSDESKVAGWIEGYKRTEPISGTPGTKGAVSDIYVESSGKEMSMQETITELNENEHIAMTFTMDFMDMDYAMHLEEKDGKTHIKTNSTTYGNGLIAKSMLSFMKGSMKKQEDKNLNNLKKLIEENTTDYSPEPTAAPAEEASES